MFVLTDKQVLEAKEVQPGASVGDQVEVQGLKPDDGVVADARGRKAGEVVTPRKDKDPPSDPKPAREPAAARPRPIPEVPGTGPDPAGRDGPGPAGGVECTTVEEP